MDEKYVSTLNGKTIKDAYTRRKISIFVTPEEFGAIGDGVADDTTALIDCLSYASENNIETLLTKTYKITSNIPITSHTHITGNGTIKQSTAKTEILSASDVEDVKIKGIAFIGVGTDYANNESMGEHSASGLYFRGTSNKNIEITECSFSNFGFASVYVWGGEKITITNTKFEMLGQDVMLPLVNYNFGLRFVFGLSDLLVKECEFDGGAIQISVGSHKTYAVKNLKIENNTFKNCYAQHGIYIQDGENININNNILTNIYADAVKLQTDPNTQGIKSVCINGNIIESSGHAINFTVTETVTTQPKARDIVIANNNCNGAVNIQWCDSNVLCTGNTISNSNSYGIRVFGSDVTVSENTIVGSGTFGMLIAGGADQLNENINILNNYVMNSGQKQNASSLHGVVINNCDRVNFCGNIVDSDDGISDYCLYLWNNLANIIIEGNKLLRAKATSIRFINNEEVTYWSNNYFINQTNTPYNHRL